MEVVAEQQQPSTGDQEVTTSEPTRMAQGLVQATKADVDDQIHNEWRIALYYCYIEIAEVDEHVDFHKSICSKDELKGRIRVSAEGINGVISGRLLACQTYEEKLRDELLRLVPRRRRRRRQVAVEKEEDDDDWELDVKYCQLRTDLTVTQQLFDSLICKATSTVVSLFEPNRSPTNNTNKSHGFSKQTNRRKRRQKQRQEQQQQKLLEESCGDFPDLQELASLVPSFPGGQHLSPREWNQKLSQATDDAVILDCRNVYESNVGYFQAPNNNGATQAQQTKTLLTNTRKYSDLPKVLAQSKDQWSTKRQIFMYCTGGVRCEQASKFVQALVAKEQQDSTSIEGETKKNILDVEVYQLHGGIQKYLEDFHTPATGIETHENGKAFQQDGTNQREAKAPTIGSNEKYHCLYRGLNFVFDPRRTDPMIDNGANTNDKTENVPSCVGKCCLCETPHDDYDNGHAPAENQEARCFKCRILLLVCSPCRETVQCWGEVHKAESGLPVLYCGVDACSDYQATGKNPVCAV